MAALPNQIPRSERTPPVRRTRPEPQKRPSRSEMARIASNFYKVMRTPNHPRYAEAMRAYCMMRLDAHLRLSEDGFNNDDAFLLKEYPQIPEVMASKNNSEVEKSPGKTTVSPAVNESAETSGEHTAEPTSGKTVSLKRAAVAKPAVSKQEAGAVALEFQANNTTEEVIPDESIISQSLVVDEQIQYLINRSPRTVRALAEFLAEHEMANNIEITPEYLRENIGNIHVDLSIAIGGRPMNSNLRRAMAFTRAVFDIVNNSNLSEVRLSEGILDETRVDRPLFTADVEDLTDLEQELSSVYREMAVREIEDLWMNSAERPVLEKLLSSFCVDYVIVSNSYKVSEYLLENSHNLMARLSNRGDDLAQDLYAGSFMRRLSEIRVRYNAMIFEDAREVNRRDNLTTEIIISARLQEREQLRALRKQRQEAIGRIEVLLRNSSEYQVLCDYLSSQYDDDRKIEVEAVRSEVLQNPARLAEYLFENISTIANRLVNLNASDPTLVELFLGGGGLIDRVIHIEHNFHRRAQLPTSSEIIPGQPFQLGHRTAMINRRKDGSYVLNTGDLIGNLFLEYRNPVGKAVPLLEINSDEIMRGNSFEIIETGQILNIAENADGSLSFVLGDRELRQQAA